jgi:hypothetical protein
MNVLLPTRDASAVGEAPAMRGVAFASNRSRLFVTLFAVVAATAAARCGRGGAAPIRVEVPPVGAQIRGLLEGYAKGDGLGSGLIAIREQIDVLPGGDAAKAEALAAELPKLESSKGAVAVKTQAAARLGTRWRFPDRPVRRTTPGGIAS